MALSRQRLGDALWAVSCVVAALSAGVPLSARADDDDPYVEAPPPDPIEVEVREPPKAADATTFTRAEVRSIPGTFGDPFRVVESIPGVVPLVSGVPYYYVRGAPPGTVSYTLDGIRVPLLFHLGLGPSVVHPALIDSVEVVPGPTPETGRALGAVVAGALTAPRESFRVEGNLRAVDTGVFLEAPFDGGRGDALVSGRVSYTALLFSLLNANTVLNYWDYAGRASYEVEPGHRVGIFGFGAYDYLAEKREQGPDELLVDTTFHRIDLFYDVDIDGRTRVEHDIVFGWDETDFAEDAEAIDRSVMLRSTLRKKATDDIEVRTGFDVTVDRYDIDLSRDGGSDFTRFFSSRTDVTMGLFMAAPMFVGPRFSMVPGLRADLFVSRDEMAVALDPSLSARVQVTPTFALEAKSGLASQGPSFIVSGPGFRPGLDQGGLQRSFTNSLGVSWKPTRDWQLEMTGYRLAFFDINDALGGGSSGEPFPDGLGKFGDRFDGTSVGMEISAKRRLSRSLGAVLSYGLGRSERTDEEGRVFPSGFDRTHVATAALTYDFGRGWRAGMKQVFYSGAPLLDAGLSGEVRVKKRLPPFYRLDWRLEKKWTLGKTGFVSFVAEALNTFVASEVVGEECEDESDPTTCGPSKIGPVAIPSLGVEGGY